MQDFLNYTINIKKQAEIKAKLEEVEDEIDAIDDQLSIENEKTLDMLLKYRRTLEEQRLDLERNYLELGLEINKFEREAYNAD